MALTAACFVWSAFLAWSAAISAANYWFKVSAGAAGATATGAGAESVDGQVPGCERQKILYFNSSLVEACVDYDKPPVRLALPPPLFKAAICLFNSASLS